MIAAQELQQRCNTIPLFAKVSSNASGNKHTYAAEAKQEGGYSRGDNILLPADPDLTTSKRARIHLTEISSRKTLRPQHNSALTDHAVSSASSEEAANFLARIKYHIIIATCYSQAIYKAFLSPTPRRVISQHHQRKLCVCLCITLHVCECVLNLFALHHPPSSRVEGLWFQEKHFT